MITCLAVPTDPSKAFAKSFELHDADTNCLNSTNLHCNAMNHNKKLKTGVYQTEMAVSLI